MMKVSFWGVAILTGLLMFGSSVYADEAKPKKESDGVLVTVTPDSIKRLREEKKQKQDAQKAKEDAEAREQEKKDKAAKSERKTGHACKSWQVKNR
jgi:hypothetical protein